MLLGCTSCDQPRRSCILSHTERHRAPKAEHVDDSGSRVKSGQVGTGRKHTCEHNGVECSETYRQYNARRWIHHSSTTGQIMSSVMSDTRIHLCYDDHLALQSPGQHNIPLDRTALCSERQTELLNPMGKPSMDTVPHYRRHWP